MTETSSDFDPGAVAIRVAEEADHVVIRDLFCCGALEGLIRVNDTGADVESLTEAYFSDDGASSFWVACHRETVVGMIGVQRTGQDTAEVRRLRVREDFRRRGIGTMLLEEAMSFCRKRSYLKVALDVRIERGPAIAMFENYGFVVARTTEQGDHKTHEFYMDLYSDKGAKNK